MSDDAGRDPGLVVRDGVPRSTRFDDVYFSRDGGIEETRHVFLHGCGLPDAWAGRAGYTIGELGFGTGLNFLVTWDLWRRARPAGGVLNFLSVEGFPIRPGPLASALRALPSLAPLAARLIDRYPAPSAGFHRIWFGDDGVCLTLAIGEVEPVLAAADARVDAWFLDGFAPARNPAMWTEAVIRRVAALSAPAARLATFTAAGEVRRSLAAAGFAVSKRPGFGAKRESVAATFGGGQGGTRRPTRVAVVGAGVAGAALVGGLARRGIETVWLERRPAIAGEASGNPVGVLMPRPTVDPTPAGDLAAAAFLHALREAAAQGVPVSGNGVLELALGGSGEARQAKLEARGALAPVTGRLVDVAEARRQSGVAVEGPGIWYRRAGWLVPADWVAALAGARRPVVSTPVRSLSTEQGHWRLHGPEDALVAECDAVILAGGAATSEFPELAGVPLAPVRGQLALIPDTGPSRRLQSVLAYGGYATPSFGGRHAAGATFDRSGFEAGLWPQPTRPEDQRRIRAGMPEAVAQLFEETGPADWGARAAIRAATPDRLPVAGPVPLPAGEGPAGLFVLSGLGSRGLMTAPLLAELVIGRMLGEPLPLARAVVDAVDPGRFLRRARRRRRGDPDGRPGA